jgi:hypothetical protein
LGACSGAQHGPELVDDQLMSQKSMRRRMQQVPSQTPGFAPEWLQQLQAVNDDLPQTTRELLEAANALQHEAAVHNAAAVVIEEDDDEAAVLELVGRECDRSVCFSMLTADRPLPRMKCMPPCHSNALRCP